MSSAGSSDEEDELYIAVHKRLVKSGEWERMSNIMRRKLDEGGWTDDVYDHAKESARAEPALVFSNLQEKVTPYAQGQVPQNVKQELMALINAFLDVNLRKGK